MNRKKILIVDDEEAVRFILKDLMDFFGYDSETVGGGLEALEMVKNKAFDMVITDINMPDMNGLELIKRIKEAHPSIDLIAITGYDMEYRYTDVIEVGASDFIVKPFENNELEAKINRIFRERELTLELERLSVKDSLTDLYNRRFFDNRLLQEVIRATRQRYDLFLIFLDIDKFKEYNDTFGHQRGDSLLKHLAAVINKSVRKGVDTTFRYGGDEFGVIAPQVTRKQAFMIAERIKSNYNDLESSKLTSLSIGIAQMVDTDISMEEKIDELLKQADDALYRSKRNGGNHIAVCEAPEN